MKKRYLVLLTLVILTTIWWIASAPPADHQIGPAHAFGDVPHAVTAVSSQEDYLAMNVSNVETEMRGYDDVAFQDSTHKAFLSSMDGWIWKFDRKTGGSEQWVQMPLIPAGIHFSPTQPNTLYVCTSRLGGRAVPEDEKVGLYKVDVASKEVTPLLTRLPKTATYPVATTFLPSDRPTFALSELDEENSRDFCLCNDMDVSEDGQRIYISEPVFSQRAAMGSGAFDEAIGLAPIGKMWQLDLVANTVSLVVDNYTFVDGLLLETTDSVENAIFFTETTKFRINKTYFSGPKAGRTELLWDNLPGLPDGLDRDENGNIWTGIIKERSGFIDLIHRKPWLKPLVLRIPHTILPVSRTTGLMAFSPDGETPLFYSMHDGSKLFDISVACPIDGELYFPTFSEELSGVFRAKNPLIQ